MDPKEIIHLAHLARIRLTDDEVQEFAEDFVSILSYVAAVKEIGSVGGEPSVRAVANVMRGDIESHAPGEYTEALLEALPQREGQYAKVKKILSNNDE